MTILAVPAADSLRQRLIDGGAALRGTPSPVPITKISLANLVIEPYFASPSPPDPAVLKVAGIQRAESDRRGSASTASRKVTPAGSSASTGGQRYVPSVLADEDELTRAVIALSSEYGRYGYRHIIALLQAAGWQVGKDRVQRMLRPPPNGRS